MDAKAAAAPKKEDQLPWVEKYRPRKLDDVSYQDDVVKTLKRTLQTGNLPHLLFYGPPGTGKTSTILAVARELYGPDLMKQRVLELNASDERGIAVVRDKIKAFAQVAVGTLNSVPGYPCPPFKIIILDEADSMTRDAQTALRRTMELYSKVTRFCIICNYVSRIIEPLTSRCAKFRYKPLDAPSMISKLKEIADKEKIQSDDAALETLVAVSEGDMRKCITLLQTAKKLITSEEKFTSDTVYEVAGVVPKSVVQKLFDSCRMDSFKALEEHVGDIVANGYPANAVLSQLVNLMMRSKDLTDTQKAVIALRIAEADKKLNDGADEYLQLMDCMSGLALCLLNKATQPLAS